MSFYVPVIRLLFASATSRDIEKQSWLRRSIIGVPQLVITIWLVQYSLLLELPIINWLLLLEPMQITYALYIIFTVHLLLKSLILVRRGTLRLSLRKSVLLGIKVNRSRTLFTVMAKDLERLWSVGLCVSTLSAIQGLILSNTTSWKTRY